jgi:hypothetical protein
MVGPVLPEKFISAATISFQHNILIRILRSLEFVCNCKSTIQIDDYCVKNEEENSNTGYSRKKASSTPPILYLRIYYYHIKMKHSKLGENVFLFFLHLQKVCQT